MPKEQNRYIIHVDMDAFFAAIEQRDNPKYRGRPVIVGADPKGGRGRGVVSTCSYEARKFGVHSAMAISIAYRKCPDAVFLPVDMEKYIEISHQINSILKEFSPKIEKVSIDEAFIDISGSYHLFGTPYKTGVLIKSKIKEKTGLTASIGLAPNKFTAKVASDVDKPDGMVEVKQEALLDFLRPLNVAKIWGVGKKSLALLNRAGVYTIGDLAAIDLNEMIRMFGKNGEQFWKLANGIDDREVSCIEEIKSISNEYTFEKDTADKIKIKNVLLRLCEKVSRRLRSEYLKGKTITLKIRFEGFETHTRSNTIIRPINHTENIYAVIKEEYGKFETAGKKIRLLGVKVSNFCIQKEQGNLFEYPVDEKRERINTAIEKIKNKFGEDSIRHTGQ